MKEEEYFRKHYPDSCYGDKPLSPYWDFFQDGVEFGERQSEKKIEELKTELTKKADTNHSLVEQMADLETENAELKEKYRQQESVIMCIDEFDTSVKLAKAKRIILNIVSWFNIKNSSPDEFYKIIKEAEEFIKEIEK